MNKKYFDIAKYDAHFSNKIMERGADIFLLDEIIGLKQKEKSYSCKIKGNNTYDVSITFKNNDDIDAVSCTCPFAKEEKYCKHIYALLLKLKCNYDFNKIEKEIKQVLKELKKIFKVYDKGYIYFKYNNQEFSKEIEGLNGQMNCFRATYDNILENNKNNTNKIIIFKDINNLIDIIEQRINNFNEYIELKRNTNSYNEEKIMETAEDDNSTGLFGLFMNALDAVNKEQDKRDKEYEDEKQRYRRAIIEQNLYDGKTNEDIYDGLE